MATRATFWVGNPLDLAHREWLGAIAFDGYPERGGKVDFDECQSEEGFRAVVKAISRHDDFAHPEGGFPFPWPNDIFLTDYTYAWFDGQVQVTCFHEGFKSWDEYWQHIDDENADEMVGEWEDALPDNVPAPSPYNPSQPDSIIIIGRRA